MRALALMAFSLITPVTHRDGVDQSSLRPSTSSQRTLNAAYHPIQARYRPPRQLPGRRRYRRIFLRLRPEFRPATSGLPDVFWKRNSTRSRLRNVPGPALLVSKGCWRARCAFGQDQPRLGLERLAEGLGDAADRKPDPEPRSRLRSVARAARLLACHTCPEGRPSGRRPGWQQQTDASGTDCAQVSGGAVGGYDPRRCRRWQRPWGACFHRSVRSPAKAGSSARTCHPPAGVGPAVRLPPHAVTRSCIAARPYLPPERASADGCSAAAGFCTQMATWMVCAATVTITGAPGACLSALVSASWTTR